MSKIPKEPKEPKAAILFKYENISLPEAMQKLEDLTQENYKHDEIYGEFCNIIQFINCPIKTVYAYLADVVNMENWTFSARNFKKIKTDLYTASDALMENTEVYIGVKNNEQNYTIEHHCAWDQSEDLWMRYYFQLIDAMPALKKPGTLLSFLITKHPYYYIKDQSILPKHILESKQRKGRTWIGEYWKYFPAAHKLEMNNLKLILEEKNSA